MAQPARTGREGRRRHPADGLVRRAGRWRFDWEWTYTRDAWLDQMRTHGILTHLPSGQVAEVLAEVGAAIDARGGSFTAPYGTVAVTAVRGVDA
ncbi:hypothetical protein [Streptomyces sp. NPDC048256]|uniref:hypothetical protein n=1 Tax=Streptomyces sp. NPDC048256 TaxID=3154613 RepID=UPI0033F3F328